MCSRATTDPDLAREVARRLIRREGRAGPRLAHVRRVVETVRAIAASSGWPAELAGAAERAAWTHDALRLDDPESHLRMIEAAGEVPDPWARAHAPALLHAQAAAAWAAARGEADPEVLMAVRHHPTGHPGWGPVGLVLYVADFCEPGRPHAGQLETVRLGRRAGEGGEGLVDAARRVLSLRLAHAVEKDRPVHPLSLEAWKRWREARE